MKSSFLLGPVFLAQSLPYGNLHSAEIPEEFTQSQVERLTSGHPFLFRSILTKQHLVCVYVYLILICHFLIDNSYSILNKTY